MAPNIRVPLQSSLSVNDFQHADVLTLFKLWETQE